MLVTMKEILDRAKKDNYGVTSIMVDRSSLSYEDNIAQTKETVKMSVRVKIILPMFLIILQSLKR